MPLAPIDVYSLCNQAAPSRCLPLLHSHSWGDTAGLGYSCLGHYSLNECGLHRRRLAAEQLYGRSGKGGARGARKVRAQGMAASQQLLLELGMGQSVNETGGLGNKKRVPTNVESRR